MKTQQKPKKIAKAVHKKKAENAAFPERTRLIRAVQTGRRKLGMTDAEYHSLIQGVSNNRTDSSKDLQPSELVQVLERMRAVGFKSVVSPQYKKIAALWFEGYKIGAVRNKSKEAMHAFITHVTHAHPLKCSPDQYRVAIEAVKKLIDGRERADFRVRQQRQFPDLPPDTPLVQ